MKMHSPPDEPTDEFIEVRRTDYESLNSRLIDALYYSDLTDNMNVHDKISFLLDTIRKCYDECTTITNKRISDKSIKCPWCNDDLKRLCNRKKTLLKRVRASPLNVSASHNLSLLEAQIRHLEECLLRGITT